VDRFFEGDPAPSEAFEELISIKSENAIGGPAVKRMIPWLRNSNKSDYVVIVTDPRQKSPEFLNTVRDLSSELPRDIFSKIVFINADTPAQNRRFLKKYNISDSNIRMYSDEKREWMQAYTALGENRWSMTLFVLADERIQKLVRDFSQISASKVVQSAIKSTEQRRL
jgi:peroxiredoxin